MKQNEEKLDLEIAELDNLIIEKTIKLLLSDFENKYNYKLKNSGVIIYRDSNYEDLLISLEAVDYESYSIIRIKTDRLKKHFYIDSDSLYKDLMGEVSEKLNLLTLQEILEILNDFK